jgi:hypothetical protein
MNSNGRRRLTTLLVVLTLIEAAAIFKLSRENGDLRTASEQARKSAASGLADKLAKRDAELQVLRIQVQELLKLRNELRQLRARSNEPARLQEENRLKAGPTNPIPAVPAANEEARLAREAWTFAGYATPEATLESSMWALRDGDLDAYIASLAPTQLALLDQQMQQENKTQEELVADLRKASEGLTGYRILEQNSPSDDTVVLRVQLNGSPDAIHQFLLIRTGSEWKMNGTGTDE